MEITCTGVASQESYSFGITEWNSSLVKSFKRYEHSQPWSVTETFGTETYGSYVASADRTQLTYVAFANILCFCLMSEFSYIWFLYVIQQSVLIIQGWHLWGFLYCSTKQNNPVFVNVKFHVYWFHGTNPCQLLGFLNYIRTFYL